MTKQRHDEINAAALIQHGYSNAQDPDTAVREAVSQISISNICFVLVFVPQGLSLDGVAVALDEALPTTSVFGCTTAGQITPKGYEDTALLIIAFPRAHFRCSSTLIEPLSSASIAQTTTQAKTLSARFPKSANWNRLALVFSDGLSKQEDTLVAALSVGLGEVPVFGGSAGNGILFEQTFVLHGGVFHTDAALLVVLETDLEFTGIGFNHFLPTDRQMVVTSAVPEERVVQELNGSPAAEEYARLVGTAVEDLSPIIFAENPVLIRNGNAWHVRAIQQVIDGTSLSFLSAIDDGLLLTLGTGREILRTLDCGLSLEQDGRAPEMILGFDCVLRRLEIEQKNIQAAVSGILMNHNVLGFNTYGEQHLGVHVNQTFVGVAFYPPKMGSLF